MRYVGRLAATLLLPICAITALAQDGRVDVTLSHVGGDSVGRRLAASLRNEFAADKRMNLVKTSDDRIGVYLVTMASEDGTVYSATWTLGGMTDDGYLTSRVGMCDSDRLRSCVRSLLSETNKHVSVLSSVRHPASR